MNIFIVEDEYWALEELKALLDKYQKDHYLFFYEDGEEAYKNALLHSPDLIITDITMPVMDGIELISKVKEVHPNTECVLLTVHDTFDYAKKAIELGVSDYLLKPVKREALDSMMDRLLSKISEKKMQELTKQLWSINQLIVNQNENDMEVFNKEELLVTYLVIGNWQAPLMQEEEKVLQELNEFSKQTEGWLVSLDEQRILLLHNDEALNILDIKQLFNKWIERSQLHVCCLKKRKHQRLVDAYQQAHQLMNQHKMFGSSTFITKNQQEVNTDMGSLWDYVRVIEKSLRDREYASIDKQLNILADQIKSLQPTQRKLRQFLLDMYYAIVFKLEQFTSEVIKVQHIDNHFTKIDTLLTFRDLRAWLKTLIDLIIPSLLDEKLAPKQLIPKVKEFIEKNYADNITFQQFARDHHVSLSYLSREFKKQTNMNFSEYLTNYRIEKAKELFDNGFSKTVEVGILVGYQDPKHFRSVFKKMTNMSPKEYKHFPQKSKMK